MKDAEAMENTQVEKDGMTPALTRRQRRIARAKATSGAASYGVDSDYESPDECDDETKKIAAVPVQNTTTSEEIQVSETKVVKDEEEELLVVDRDAKRGQELTHTKSLPPETKNTRNFAQRQCEELSMKLMIAEKAHLELREKITDLEENRNMVMDQANEVQTENDSLDRRLLEKEKECKGLTGKNEQFSSLLLQARKDLAAEKRDNRVLKDKIRDLEEDLKHANEANYALQEEHDPCQTEIAELRSQRDGNYTKGMDILRQRNELRKNILTLTATVEELKLEVWHAKRDLQECEIARSNLAQSESKLRDAARGWKDRYTKASQENADLIRTGSKLAEQNSALRQEHAVVDDSMLKESLASLNYDIRDWCDQIVDAKPAGASAYLSHFPNSDHTFFLTDLGDKELNALIACVWEGLLRLILGPEVLPDGRVKYQDLWTDKGTRASLNDLENRFASKG